MSNNITFSTEDIGSGVQLDRTKVVLGASGTDGGDVSSTNPIPANVSQVGGTATDTNSGNKSAGTQRIVIATDQPQLTNALKVDGSAVTQPVSQSSASNLLASVGGLGAAGSAVTGNPVLIAGSDGTDARTLSTDANGKLYVLPKKISVTVDNVASATYTTSGNGSSYDVSAYSYLLVGIHVTARSGSGPCYFYLMGQGPDGAWYGINDNDANFNLASNGKWLFAVGPGTFGDVMPNMGSLFPTNIQPTWDFGGGLTSITFSYWIIGQSF